MKVHIFIAFTYAILIVNLQLDIDSFFLNITYKVVLTLVIDYLFLLSIKTLLYLFNNSGAIEYIYDILSHEFSFWKSMLIIFIISIVTTTITAYVDKTKTNKPDTYLTYQYQSY